MGVPDRIERGLELRHPPEKVWAALTTAEGLGGWLGTYAEVEELRPGGRARVRWGQGKEDTLVFQVVQPPHLLAYTWAIEGLPPSDPRRTYVEFTLEPTSAGTRLTVVETGFAQLPDAYETNVQGWRTKLAELIDYLDAA
ncbi:ATPase [Actinomadura sp. GC306]|uniref:SRPBCC domain-containing protein n=1 Tax=Actinomadura sp. GC306 TaxID=2530367 RepID=UPI00104A8FF0|nr:SRPBCC domain-containing protein [Actinomadura sp. GC306]TDC61782.1 ATPase [Actinomadura sp. GC306]